MDASLLTALGLLNCVVFKRLSAKEFEVIYKAGTWLDELLPETVNSQVFCFEQNLFFNTIPIEHISETHKWKHICKF